MRLLSLRLIGKYKGLKDQYFDLHNTHGSIVALIGLNGSGKSQLLELIAEIFAFLERTQRSDFRVKSPLGFGFDLKYEAGNALFEPQIGSPVIYRVELESNEKHPRAYYWRDGEWNNRSIESVTLPYVVGYSSGLNENIQRSFLKNAVQYFEIQRIRQLHRKELVGGLEVDQYEAVNKKYLNKYPHIFSEEKYSSNDILSTSESDTAISKAIYIDYDNASLMLASMAVLPRSDLEGLFEEVTYRYPEKVTFVYNFRGGVFEETAIRDIKLLIRIAGDDSFSGIGGRSTDEQFEIYELDYLAGSISLDLKSSRVIDALREANYHSPLVLFSRLYKIQLLGLKNMRYDFRLSLQKDGFLGTVKKPLKTKLPLSVTELILSDGNGSTVCFDDLSDGEFQLMQILATTKVFSSDESLLLFDEPETHLNPAWRTYFHRYLNNAISSGEEHKNPQVLLSTHSPFMLSSLKREDVLHFERDESGSIEMSPVDSQTFGASFDVLIKKYFGLRSLISQTAVEEVKHHLPNEENQNTSESASAWIEENLGDSVEKAYLLRKLKN